MHERKIATSQRERQKLLKTQTKDSNGVYRLSYYENNLLSIYYKIAANGNIFVRTFIIFFLISKIIMYLLARGGNDMDADRRFVARSEAHAFIDESVNGLHIRLKEFLLSINHLTFASVAKLAEVVSNFLGCMKYVCSRCIAASSFVNRFQPTWL